MPVSLSTDNLASLQSADELSLLDAIDQLRSQGVSHYVSLPQLIVCGDQSSGKSSVLEAISGVPFPTKDNLCTRFATELILRRTSKAEVSITIVPGQNRSTAECKRLSQFQETLTDFSEFPNLIELAKEFLGMSTTMGASAPANAFSEDVLRVEISGPDQQHLTIVDLPGLIHSGNKLQTDSDVALVLSMVKAYMANPRSIILAVVSAKNDYANQIVTKLAKDVDVKGHRTLGIITKPDTLSGGSESETAYANLARNQDVEFRLGWHILRNRDYETRNTTMEDRNAAEELFFSRGIWADFPRHLVGINSLRPRLSKVLLDQIKKELPSLLAEIERMASEVRDILNKLGASRDSIDEQRLFLLNISQSFQSIVTAAVDGIYGDPFFGDCRSPEGYSRRLRAVVQNLNMEFAELMRTNGHRRQILEHKEQELQDPDSAQSEASSRFTEPELIEKAVFLDEVTELLKRSRGRELPGMFNPSIVGDLFHDQSSPWERLIKDHLKNIWDATRAFLELVTLHLTDDFTADALLKVVVDPLMEERSQEMAVKLVELLLPHQKGHPITYNHYFTETIQSMRSRRQEEDITRRLSKVFGPDLTNLEHLPMKKVNPSRLISALTSSEADMDRYASSEVLDCMQAYYKVAMKTIIDNVAVQAVETQLVGKLRDLLSPALIIQMQPDLIHKIASEPSENRSTRDQLTRKLAILRAGIDTCKRYAARSATNLQHRPWITEVDDDQDDDDDDDDDDKSPSPEPVENCPSPVPETPRATKAIAIESPALFTFSAPKPKKKKNPIDWN